MLQFAPPVDGISQGTLMSFVFDASRQLHGAQCSEVIHRRALELCEASQRRCAAEASFHLIVLLQRNLLYQSEEKWFQYVFHVYVMESLRFIALAQVRERNGLFQQMQGRPVM
jgi:hypothetical protein